MIRAINNVREMTHQMSAEQICAFMAEQEGGFASSMSNITASTGISILCAALPGSEIVLQPTQPFRDWAKYCRAPRWCIASRPSGFTFAAHLYARTNPATSVAEPYIFQQPASIHSDQPPASESGFSWFWYFL
jgi:hypothetical protein